jgi:ABC-2 type transport system ATP-binding protein
MTAPDAPDIVIQTTALTKIYNGDVTAVDSLDLSVHRGEIFGLLGPNGAGKTTTAGMLTTRVKPTSGQAFVGGVDVWKHPAQAKRMIGVVPQSNTLDRSLTVYENLYFHGRFFGMNARSAKADANMLLGRFRLTERAGMPVLALSGGMAQRLMVARAVMHRPSILFLDEPTAGLDPGGVRQLRETIARLSTDLGMTVFMNTHLLSEVARVCTTIGVLNQGELIYRDSMAETTRRFPDEASLEDIYVRVGQDPA